MMGAVGASCNEQTKKRQVEGHIRAYHEAEWSLQL